MSTNNIDALSAAAASMASDVSRLSVISQNLTNATTPGYKRSVAAFEHVLDAAAVAGDSAAVDHRTGSLRFTGNALDFALDGEGFFEVQTEGGPAYTRRGDFRVDATGQLVTQAGHVVQGTGGALQVGAASPSVDREGRLKDGDRLLGQLKVVRFANLHELQRADGGLFRSTQAPQPESAGRVRQGHLEASNVNTASEMVRLMETMRHFEAAQKLVQGIDDMNERALRKLGEF